MPLMGWDVFCDAPPPTICNRRHVGSERTAKPVSKSCNGCSESVKLAGDQCPLYRAEKIIRHTHSRETDALLVARSLDVAHKVEELFEEDWSGHTGRSCCDVTAVEAIKSKVEPLKRSAAVPRDARKGQILCVTLLGRVAEVEEARRSVVVCCGVCASSTPALPGTRPKLRYGASFMTARNVAASDKRRCGEMVPGVVQPERTPTSPPCRVVRGRCYRHGGPSKGQATAPANQCRSIALGCAVDWSSRGLADRQSCESRRGGELKTSAELRGASGGQVSNRRDGTANRSEPLARSRPSVNAHAC